MREIRKIREHPDMAQAAAGWFHEKWGIPLKAYRESIEACLRRENPVPQWYLAVEEDRIVGGLGVIENDYHNRPDLAPNVCAVFVEEAYRCRGIAGELLETVCSDMAAQGVEPLYLLTDHDSFYERYGWEFHCMVQGDGETDMSRMYIHRQDTGK
ncbi:MAG: GNAT family N-acetyltransferase [Lachnospiraceae bacterium]|nr:GNAT family N-acetyltransferase [Lachnospiraceae bacterium]